MGVGLRKEVAKRGSIGNLHIAHPGNYISEDN